MPERPLLVFPEPENASRSVPPHGAGHFHGPDHARQGRRLTPRFRQLQTAFEARRIEVQQTVAGVDPEQVLVIEAIGGVEQLANAVKRIDGLEWMGELELDEVLPDADFYDEVHPEKFLSGRLYLVMSNQRALGELLSLWRRYKSNPNMEFQHGLTRFRDVFDTLKDVRRWDVQDRLHETGLFDSWKHDLEHVGDGPVRFEAELWYRSDAAKRAASERVLNHLVTQLKGRVVTQCLIFEIAYHALLGELPRNAIRKIVDDPSTELVKCDSVMFFRPVGQMAAGNRQPEGEPVAYPPPAQQPLPTRPPVVAVLDGLPLANHHLLEDRLVIDDPDDWASEYSAAERAHGTAMASLVVHGDMNRPGSALGSRVYVRPIMKPLIGLDHPLVECMPTDVLPVDLIHRAVRRLFDGDGGEGPVANTVKVVNVSIGDPSRQFDRAMSPLARLLDWLSLKYRVLFVVSAGNCLRDISMGMSEEDFDALAPAQREGAVVRAILREGRLRRLLSPAEAINALTIGAWHEDASQVAHLGPRIDPYENALPSPLSPLGSGYRRSVKPDMLFTAGRQLYRKPVVGLSHDSICLELARFISPPGCRAAHPGSQGMLNGTAHCVGTSNATALVSRFGALCYDELASVLASQAPQIQAGPYAVPLLKALMVHGASWGGIEVRLREIVGNDGDALSMKNLLTRWLGYGVPDFDRAIECSAQRATVLGFGDLTDGTAHVFRLPLPPSLASKSEWRRLTVTLAWLSPTVPGAQKYRTASLWYEAKVAGLDASRRAVDWRAVRRGTVQHEVFEGDRAVPIADGDVVAIKVNCRREAGKIDHSIPYGLVVSLEVAEGIDIAVYEEVRQRIAIPIQVRQAATGEHL